MEAYIIKYEEKSDEPMIKIPLYLESLKKDVYTQAATFKYQLVNKLNEATIFSEKYFAEDFCKYAKLSNQMFSIIKVSIEIIKEA